MRAAGIASSLHSPTMSSLQRPFGGRAALVAPKIGHVAVLRRGKRGCRCQISPLAAHPPTDHTAEHLLRAPPAGLPLTVHCAQKSEKKGKEQQVFLGVKGNAQLLGMKVRKQNRGILRRWRQQKHQPIPFSSTPETQPQPLLFLLHYPPSLPPCLPVTPTGR
jgi:hypothetical protein